VKPHLEAANKIKQARAHAAVIESVTALTRSGRPVNVYAVHRESGVARSFIYNRTELLALIEQNRAETPRLRQAQSRARSSDESLRHRLADAIDRVRDLTQERDELAAHNKALLTELRRLRQRSR
jgi:hypothetical protein